MRAPTSDLREILLPEPCLVVLVGVPGVGKSSFAARHFRPTEVISSDHLRALITDDERAQTATADAFELVHLLASKRLSHGRLAVVDATSVRSEDRQKLVHIARERECRAIAIVLDLPLAEAIARDRAREGRSVGAPAIERHHARLRAGAARLAHEGFAAVHVLRSADELAGVTIRRAPLPCDRRGERGPFDIIGDVHGCADELRALLIALGYRISGDPTAPVVESPHGRKVIFLGDLVDRGPDAPGALRLAMAMVRAGDALCLVGNHEDKLRRHLQGRAVKLTHGLAATVEQLAREPASFADELAAFIDGLFHHYVLDDGRLVVAHAGLIERYHGRSSGRVRAFCYYGETNGERDEYGLPVRLDWAATYSGAARVVYGHTPTASATWVNRTICIDTGCVFGGALTALRYPELELVAVPAARVYYEPTRPLARASDQPPAAEDERP
ncbi:MAG: AAA family ATPase [Nannocystis sp.]|nr:AAA family ATPase [Nannocystis sp.]